MRLTYLRRRWRSPIRVPFCSREIVILSLRRLKSVSQSVNHPPARDAGSRYLVCASLERRLSLGLFRIHTTPPLDVISSPHLDDVFFRAGHARDVPERRWGLRKWRFGKLRRGGDWTSLGRSAIALGVVGDMLDFQKDCLPLLSLGSSGNDGRLSGEMSIERWIDVMRGM